MLLPTDYIKQDGERVTKKDNNGRGTWGTSVNFDLGNNLRLKWYTRKRHDGKLVTTASVCEVEHREYNGLNYTSEKHVIGVAGDGDYYQNIIIEQPARITAKVVDDQMDRALSQWLEHVKCAVVTKYRDILFPDMEKQAARIAELEAFIKLKKEEGMNMECSFANDELQKLKARKPVVDLVTVTKEAV